MAQPRVDVIMPSYNHAPYVAEAMESVLGQTFTDFTVLVSDDGSTDGTVDILRRYTDPRIRLHVFERNQGATINGRYLLDRCQAEYIALINSDDVWLPTRLDKGVAYLDAHPECGAVFAWSGIIDENSAQLSENCDVFHQPNRTRTEWIRHFFTKGNCICHPSMLIRREVYEKCGSYCLGMRQLPDFWMWVRTVKQYEIHILQEVLVQHRRCVSTKQNTSAPVPDNSIRDINESLYILLHFLDGMDDGLFKEAFGKLFRNKNAATEQQLLCEKFFLLADGYYYMDKINSLAAMYFYLEHCDRTDVLKVMAEEYHYTLNDFYRVGAALNIAGIQTGRVETAADPIFNRTHPLKKVFGDTKAYATLRAVYHRIKGE